MKLTRKPNNKHSNTKALFLCVQIPLLFFTLSLLSACSQDTDKTQANETSKTSSPVRLIYRPKLKLAFYDPVVIKQYRAAVLTLIPPDQDDEKITKKNYINARKLFLPLAEAGYVDAMFGVAATYFPYLASGPYKIPSNPKKGIPWLTKAANAGHAAAQYLTAEWHYAGWRDYTPLDNMNSYSKDRWGTINHYYTASAEQGFQMAQGALAMLRYNANDDFRVLPREEAEAKTPERTIETYVWYTLSSLHWNRARQSERKSKGMIDRHALDISLRKQVIEDRNMTAKQITEAEQRITKWIKQHPDAYTEPRTPLELSLEKQAILFTDSSKNKL